MATGDNIRRHRKTKGLTQAQLADAMGLTEGTTRHYETRSKTSRHLPPRERAGRLS